MPGLGRGGGDRTAGQPQPGRDRTLSGPSVQGRGAVFGAGHTNWTWTHIEAGPLSVQKFMKCFTINDNGTKYNRKMFFFLPRNPTFSLAVYTDSLVCP